MLHSRERERESERERERERTYIFVTNRMVVGSVKHCEARVVWVIVMGTNRTKYYRRCVTLLYSQICFSHYTSLFADGVHSGLV